MARWAAVLRQQRCVYHTYTAPFSCTMCAFGFAVMYHVSYLLYFQQEHGRLVRSAPPPPHPLVLGEKARGRGEHLLRGVQPAIEVRERQELSLIHI